MDRQNQQTTDGELLRRYVRIGDQDAFAQLVSRHISTVYAAARRQVRDKHLAEDVTQAVLMVMARRAAVIRDPANLPGWLLKVTWFASRDAIKRRNRRLHHEQQVTLMRDTDKPYSQEDHTRAWQEIAPILDDALARLNDSERSAVMLRYLEDRTPREVAALLGITGAAASKRTSRGLNHLRRLLGRRGIIAPAALLTGALSISAAEAAPPHLAAAITATNSPAASAAALAKGTLMAMTKTKIVAAVAIACFALAIPATVIVTYKLISPPEVLPISSTTPSSDPAADFQRIYSLKDNQSLAYIPPEYKKIREAFYQADPTWRSNPAAPYAMLIQSQNGRLQPRGLYSFGLGLDGLLEIAGNLSRRQMDDRAGILSTSFPGDFVYDPSVPLDKHLAALKQIIHDQFRRSINFSLRDVTQSTIVLSGSWQPGIAATPSGAAPAIEVWAASNPISSDAYSGDATTFAAELGDWLGRHVVIEAVGVPDKLQWRVTEAFAAASPPGSQARNDALDNLRRQTGLSWSEQQRPVQELFVECDASDPLAAYYTLSDSDALKRVIVPDETRQALFRFLNPTGNRQGNLVPSAMILLLSDGGAQTYAWDDNHSYTFASALKPILGIYPQQIEGQGEDFLMPGDYVCRIDSTVDQRLSALQAILRNELHRDVKLTFRDVPRKVLVLDGQWNFTPAASPRKRTGAVPGIELYDDKIVRNPATRATGDENQFAGELGQWLGTQILIEAQGVPPNLLWFFNQPTDRAGDVNHVMDHLAQQTGLHWSEETRNVRRLFVEMAQ